MCLQRRSRCRVVRPAHQQVCEAAYAHGPLRCPLIRSQNLKDSKFYYYRTANKRGKGQLDKENSWILDELPGSNKRFTEDFEQTELPAKLLEYFLRSNKSKINQKGEVRRGVMEKGWREKGGTIEDDSFCLVLFMLSDTLLTPQAVENAYELCTVIGEPGSARPEGTPTMDHGHVYVISCMIV